MIETFKTHWLDICVPAVVRDDGGAIEATLEDIKSKYLQMCACVCTAPPIIAPKLYLGGPPCGTVSLQQTGVRISQIQ